MIQSGQIYRPCDPRGGARIRITAYRPGDARAHVVDAVTGKRPRQILVKDLHESPVTATGRRRRSGYVLDRDTPEVPQEATERRLSASEGSSGDAEALRGQNDAQASAERLDGDQQPRGPVDWARQQAAERETQAEPGSLQQRITAAIRDTHACYPDDIATAVWRVVEQHLDIRSEEAWCKTCRRVWGGPGHQCETDAERRLAHIREVASTWFAEGEPGPTRNAGKFLLRILDWPAYEAGPSDPKETP
jgi:hypothetical protein